MTELHNRQIELENESSLLGINRYNRDRPMPWRDETGTNSKQESDLAPGKRLLHRAVPKIAAAIEQYVGDYDKGKAGRKQKAAVYLSTVDVNEAAYITTRHCINALMKEQTFTRVAMGVATLIEDHVRLLQFEESDDAALLWHTMKLSKGSSNEKMRTGRLRRALREVDVAGLGWDDRDKMRVGTKLVEFFVDVTGLAEMRLRRRGRKSRYKFEPTKRAMQWLEEQHSQEALLSPIHMPMLVEPLDWTTPTDGGYLTHDAARTTVMVKTSKRRTLDELFNVNMPEVYDAVNSLQKTKWQVTQCVLSVAQELWAAESELAGLPRRKETEVPERPDDIPRDCKITDLPEEQQVRIKDWKGAAATAYALNAKLFSRRLATAQQLWVGQKFKNDTFYFPYCLDFRGRIYTIPVGLNPQGDDLSKGLLEFAEGRPLGQDGAYWLAVHLANSYGHDKVSLDERVQWTQENQDLILDSALNPLDGDRWWSRGELPWQTLAACVSWAGYVMEGDEYVCHTPIGMDGSCSGLQHFSALLLDEQGGRAVNLLPGERRDIYQEVADRVSLSIADDPELVAWRGKVTRKIVKQPAMTYAYSVTQRGIRDQMIAAMVKLCPNGDYLGSMRNFEAANKLAPHVIRAIESVVVAAADAMTWLRGTARELSRADLPVIWTSPVGLPVLQAETKYSLTRCYAWFGGRQIQFRLPTDTRKIDSRKQQAAIAPNFVHSLDAAHLMRTVNASVECGIKDFAMVHDSFGTHASQVSELNHILRREFIRMYSEEDIIGDFMRGLPDLEGLPEPPKSGSLDLKAVMGSEFFFA